MAFVTPLGDLELGEFKIFNYFEKEFGPTSEKASTMLAMDDVPDEAGTYVLTCTVTAGEEETDPPTVAFSWEATESGT